MTEIDPHAPPDAHDAHDAHDADEFVPADDAVIGRAFRRSLLVIGIVAAVVVIVFFVPKGGKDVPVAIDRPPVAAPDKLDQRADEIPRVVFADVTTGAGIDFVHESGAAGDKFLPEAMGGGCAFFDADGDGDQDLLLVNSCRWPDAEAAGEDGPPPTMALYRNDGRGSFTDATVESGLDLSFYGVGAAVGDYDGDGDVDVFITALGPNRLLRNDDGVFTDVTTSAGVGGPGNAWSTSAGFLDYDGDGRLDLFVCNYVEWSREIDLELGFTLNGTDRAYGPPKLYRGTVSRLYRNEGDGTFADVTEAAGIAVRNPATGEPLGKALGVTFIDVDGDGLLDILVANDTVQNFIFRNRGDGGFEEMGASSGFAFDEMGAATGAMGIDGGDIGNDGGLAIGVANFANESTSLYVQQRGGWQFADTAGSAGIGSPSRLKLTFGLLLLDYDLDGRLDLLQANGHLEETINELQASQHYRQPAQLFWNTGTAGRTRFAAAPDETLGDLATPVVGRGASCADIDGDGDLDVLITQTGGRPLLLRNDQDLGHHWLTVTLVGAGGNTGAIGAVVELTAGGVTQRRHVMPTRSYLSQVALPLTFGLGGTAEIDSVRVTWPGGGTQAVVAPPADRVLVIRESVSAGP